MEYFRLMQDKRLTRGVLFNLNAFPKFMEAKSGHYGNLKTMTVAFANSSKFNVYPDVLDRQLYMISEQIKDVFNLYAPQIDYKFCCILDNENDVCNFYYIPEFELVDCFSEQSEYNLDRSIISRIAIKRNAITGKEIFRVSGIKDTVIIVSLDVAESILRRHVAGARFQRVGIE